MLSPACSLPKLRLICLVLVASRPNCCELQHSQALILSLGYSLLQLRLICLSLAEHCPNCCALLQSQVLMRSPAYSGAAASSDLPRSFSVIPRL